MRVFVSYRRADSSPTAHTVTRALERSPVGGEPCEVFIDVDKIPLGTDFTRVLKMAMESCDIALEIVGRNWLVTDGRRRLDDANDFVRAEVRQAIREKVPLLAVLVDGAMLPNRSELPGDIRALVDSRVVRLDDETFDDSIEELLSVVGGIGRRPGRAPAPATVRFVTDGHIGFPYSGDQRHVQVDGETVGTLVSGAETAIMVPAGEHSVRLGRGMLWSPPVAVTLGGGETATLAYKIRGLGKASLRRIGR
ncbi:MAG: toll/interleukin-1 receptor domain-containing protein [Actinomycetota bacterium]|nr:toll/interleukin-1 receptor domain-containing protein [Actinomycetota bacterium]